jgi:hypothetical protein
MDITTWLRDLELEQYAQAFHDNGIEPRVLPDLTADDLKDIGTRWSATAASCSRRFPSFARRHRKFSAAPVPEREQEAQRPSADS